MSEEEEGFTVNHSSQDRKNTENQVKALNDNFKGLNDLRGEMSKLTTNLKNIGMGKQADAMNNLSRTFDNAAKQFAGEAIKQKVDNITGGKSGKMGLPTSITGAIDQIGKMLSDKFAALEKFGNKLGGFKGVIAGALAAAIGLAMGKVIDSSPLLQAVLKIMNTSMTLILRPIGDLVGSILRPLALYFLKDVAIPFFKAFQPLSRDATQLSRGLASLLLNPINMISASIIKGMKNFFPPLVSSKANSWSKIALEDPARMTRRDLGVGEFRYGGGSLVPMVQELNKIGATGSFMNSEGQMQNIKSGGWTEELRTQMMDSEQMIEYDRAEMEKLRLSIFEKYGFQLSEAQKRTGLSSGRGTTIVGQGGAVSEEITPSVTAGMWDEIEYQSEEVLDSAENMAENIDDASTEFEIISDAAGDMKVESDSWWDALVNAWNGLFTSTEQTSKEADDWWGTQWNNLEQWGQDTWDVLFGWKVGQQAFAEEMDQSTHEIVKDINRLDRTLDRGTFDIGKAFWDGLSWMGDAVVTGITDFGQSIETGIGWLSDMIHGSGAELNQTISGLNYAFTTAEEAIMTSANLATGGLFNPQAASNPGGTFHVGTDASGMNYSYTSNVMSDEAAHTSAIASTGGQPLGDVTGNKFEFSPSKFGDIWRDGVKIDPTSPEGKQIQAQYQKQYENKLANEAQRKHFDSVRDLSTAAEAQAYVMAGGGEEGLKAAAFTKEHNLDLQNWEGLAKLGEAGFAEGHEHVVVAKAEVAAAKTLGLSSGWSSQANANTAAGTFGTAHGWGSPPSASSVASSSSSSSRSSSSSGGRPSGGRGGSSPGSGGGSGSSGSSGSSKGSSGSSKGGGSSAGGSGGNRGGSGGGGAGSGGSGGSGSGSGSKGSGGGKGSGRGGKGKGGAGSSARFGGIIDEPIIGIGLNSGDLWSLGEDGREIVIPEDRGNVGGVNVLNINVGNITKEADYLKLKPLVQRWMLEAASRRGNV